MSYDQVKNMYVSIEFKTGVGYPRYLVADDIIATVPVGALGVLRLCDSQMRNFIYLGKSSYLHYFGVWFTDSGCVGHMTVLEGDVFVFHFERLAH